MMKLVFRIDAIEPNRRLVIQEEIIENLVLSISREGQLEPILICQRGLSFRIIDGEKRWRAIKKLRGSTILVEVES